MIYQEIRISDDYNSFFRIHRHRFDRKRTPKGALPIKYTADGTGCFYGIFIFTFELNNQFNLGFFVAYEFTSRFCVLVRIMMGSPRFWTNFP